MEFYLIYFESTFKSIFHAIIFYFIETSTIFANFQYFFVNLFYFIVIKYNLIVFFNILMIYFLIRVVILHITCFFT